MHTDQYIPGKTRGICFATMARERRIGKGAQFLIRNEKKTTTE